MRWDEFEKACPELAGLARERFTRDQLAILGTLRSDGSVRISPCEVDFAAGDLLFGMMWESRKALDLMRDPRLTVHSVPPNKENPDGDLKLYGTAVPVTDPDARRAFVDAIEARIQWHPPGDYHLYAFDVQRASHVRFSDAEGMRVSRWRPGTEVVTELRPG
ncbi:pyridoxamine 5'-phosphate oxidase family protein [Actinocatenispora rupis]|uniref:Pyridoxamine 5'-phosphate oxidase N-terminal domain-containing protein n=1 Tax=Actinocatenispora rupis TaxID=519421 RepID=A0A8J3J6T4_9ACTN|nr:pyridoxamine 5'-phosphate oxidase family protein [Actinocatenispora rupis]GID15900.1 hypothetical protein Aru02nite_67890 [Actinocatenispora rupis]